MLTKFQKNKLTEMVIKLLPEYKYVRITKRGNVIMKPSFWSFIRVKIHFLELCLTTLSPKISDVKFKDPSWSLAYYLGMWKNFNSGYTTEIIDYLYSEFSRFKSKQQLVEIEVYLQDLQENKDYYIIPTEHADGEEIPIKTKLMLLAQSKTFKLTLFLLGLASLAKAM